jgi:hypothetical protein
MVDDESNGIVSHYYIALAADIGLRFVANRLFIDEWVSRKDYIAKLPFGIVLLEVVVGVWIFLHGLTQGRKCEVFGILVYQHLL